MNSKSRPILRFWRQQHNSSKYHPYDQGNVFIEHTVKKTDMIKISMYNIKIILGRGGGGGRDLKKEKQGGRLAVRGSCVSADEMIVCLFSL
jgi:hypothetical protein